MWTTPSLCPGWDVHHVLAHIVDTARAFEGPGKSSLTEV
ncbi:maleylpyruvate isomerase N-terminal domain-containing protein [Mycolicibacterium iranicum]|nr:maleylpyruvate isomerase N-terminal domain-containing protein [Mycolicibacterium iranicum]